MTRVSILVVCTANICRSPFAQLLLQQELDAVSPGGFVVESAGTQAIPGRPIDSGSAELLRRHGIDGDTITARRLHPTQVAEHELILTMTRAQRSEVLVMHPSALKRVFTLREFTRLLRTIDAPTLSTQSLQWPEIIPLLSSRRTTARAADPLDDDVADPYRRGSLAFDAMEAEVGQCIDEIVDLERRRLG